MDRVVALGQLSEIKGLMLRNRIVVMSMMVHPTSEEITKRASEFDANILVIDKVWAEYKATYLIPDEKTAIGEFEVAQLAMDVTADLKGRGEGVDAIEAGVEGLLGFFDRCVRGVECLVEVSSGAQGFHAVLKNANEGSGRRVHKGGY